MAVVYCSIMTTKRIVTMLATVAVLTAVEVQARGPVPEEIGASKQEVGSAGVLWYTTWDTAIAEANRSQKPIFFMAAAAQCNGISGVF